MAYKTIRISPPSSTETKGSVLVIYTGGTFGMVYDPQARDLVPFDFEQAFYRLPDLHRLQLDITILTLPVLVDSSNMKPNTWVELATIIETHYNDYTSFVILHGTDTMSYTASALSYMLEGLNKPVLLTGAQLPIGVARSDARENFITALEIATAQENGAPIVPEVCVYFNSLLLRGNRSSKRESVQFNAFSSENYPHLANAGVSIDYNRPYIRPYEPASRLTVQKKVDTNVTILKLFPGISPSVVSSILSIPDLKGVVLETFGAGNAPTDSWFLEMLQTAIKHGILLFNVSQCEGGRVAQGHYQTSTQLQQLGVVSGADITTEAAITKLMVLLGRETHWNTASSLQLRAELGKPLCGEMS